MDRDHTPHPLALPARDAFASPALEPDDDGPSRRCVRCRVVFEDVPTLDIKGKTRHEWSLCPACQVIAFPKRRRSSATLTIVRPPLSDQDRPDPS